MHPPLHELENIYRRICREMKADDARCKSLLRVYLDLIVALSDISALHFNTIFSRVSFITTRYQLSRPWSYALQVIRRELNERQLQDQELIPIVREAIEYLLLLYQAETSDTPHQVSAPKVPRLPPARTAGRFRKQFARVVVLEWDQAKKLLIVLDEETPDEPCTLHYCEHGINDIFCASIEVAIQELGLPMTLGLVDVHTTEENHYIPSFIIIMPDLLIDVTVIAQALPSGGAPLAVNMIEQFLPRETNEAILTGHVANFFLDELIRDTSASFEDLFIRSFRLYPIEYVRMDDDQLRGMQQRMQIHYRNILQAIEKQFPSVGIDKRQCIIEPSYFSPHYGIKGRLDLYYQHKEDHNASIVELKSNRPFRPNSYGLSEANYHQTLLYELLIKSVHGPKHHRANFILYSSQDDNPLRYAASIESLQKETIQKRNELVILSWRMLRLDQPGATDIFEEIRPELYPDLKGYLLTNLRQWHVIYEQLSPGEKGYFRLFTAFIAREHMLARIGNENDEGVSGLASLWLDNPEVKDQRYQILRGLKLEEIDQTQEQTLIQFLRTEMTNPLANFRAGDIAILYPYSDAKILPTQYQLYRANVMSVSSTHVTVRLRNNQIHTGEFDIHEAWNIEHDLLDSSFRGLYQSLWSFVSSDLVRRQLFLGLKKPEARIHKTIWPEPHGLTEHQLTIYQEVLNAGPMYLLWGPPGTGKTSRMLRSWVWYYFHHTDCRILLLAYTNKAVDEMCEAITGLGSEVSEHYLRIGSRAGTGESYRCRLIDQVIAPFNRRSEIKSLLDNTRIFVGTVASVQGKSELFRMINFDVAIVDEASQILEPAMIGLLTKFRKTVLIGDHMQLPAVSVQAVHLRKKNLDNSWAPRIGLTDAGMSYFERIYRLYESKGWNEVIGILHEQGRMHQDIQAYANQWVYNGQLSCLDPAGQSVPLGMWTGESSHPLMNHRLLYVSTSSRLDEIHGKSNDEETAVVLSLILAWRQVLDQRSLGWSIGVITPFRSQIASILHHAHQQEISLEGVTVDTVERYQGGARDIIIMSAAVNSHSMMSRIVSLNDEQIDRKLNVAVTRARQQFILVGNAEFLSTEKAYKGLMEMCEKLDWHTDVQMQELTHS